MDAEADKLLARLIISYSSHRLVRDLAIGDQQMVELAKGLSFDAKVSIMDEPPDALTDTETESLFKVMRELKAEGRGIVYISHRLKEIFEFAMTLRFSVTVSSLLNARLLSCKKIH